MNTKSKVISGIASAAILFSSLSILNPKASALEAGQALQQLSSVPKAELPAKAASLVLTAQGEDREKATATIVGAAVDLSPVAAPIIVSSVSKLSPDMAPIAAVTAAAKQPKELGAIAKAAATAAPAQSLKIVSALCKAQPGEYGTIATAVAEAVPKMDRSIISTVVEAVPTLKPFYLRATEVLAKENDGNPVVARYMEQMSRDIDISARALRTSEQTLVASGITLAQQSALPSPPAPTTPVLRPRFQPLPGAPGEINRNQTVVIPPTGTRYSSP